MPYGTPFAIGPFAQLAGSVIANLHEMDSQLALDLIENGDALKIILAEALTRPNLDRALIALGKKFEPKSISPILQFIDEVTIAARTTRFVPKNAFVVNMKPGSHMKFKYIVYRFQLHQMVRREGRRADCRNDTSLVCPHASVGIRPSHERNR